MKLSFLKITLTDRMVIKNFLFPFILCLLFLIFMMHITELFDRLDYFTSVRAPISRIFLYFLFKSPFILCEFMPVAALFATVFSLAEMNRFNETIAVFSAGTSYYRMVFPLIVLGILLFGFTIFFNEKVVPVSSARANELSTNISGKKEKKRNLRPVYNIKKFTRDRDIIIADKFLPSEEKIYNITLIKRSFPPKRVDADSARWDLKKNIWILSNVQIGNFSTNNIVKIEEKKTIEHTLGGEKPENFRKEDKMIQDMTISEAADYIQRLKDSGFSSAKEEVEFNWKFSFPFGILIMILIGAPLAGLFRRNILITSLFYSFIITICYYNLLYLGLTLGKNEILPPVLAAWIGNILFLFPLILFLKKTRT